MMSQMVAHWRRSTRRKRGYRDHRFHRNVAAEDRVAWKRYAFLETWRETKAQSLPRTRSQHIDQRVHRTTHYMSCKTGRWVTDACSGAFRCKRDSVTSYDVAKARRNACGGGGNREETSRGRDTTLFPRALDLQATCLQPSPRFRRQLCSLEL